MSRKGLRCSAAVRGIHADQSICKCAFTTELLRVINAYPGCDSNTGGMNVGFGGYIMTMSCRQCKKHNINVNMASQHYSSGLFNTQGQDAEMN